MSEHQTGSVSSIKSRPDRPLSLTERLRAIARQTRPTRKSKDKPGVRVKQKPLSPFGALRILIRPGTVNK